MLTEREPAQQKCDDTQTQGDMPSVRLHDHQAQPAQSKAEGGIIGHGRKRIGQSDQDSICRVPAKQDHQPKQY